MRYITETKNLFDISSAKKVSGGPSFSKNGNQIKVSMRSAETWKSANVLLDTSLVGKTVTVTALAMTSGINKTNIRIQWLANSGLARGSNIHTNTITGNSFQKITLTGVVPESPGGDFTNLCIMFYANADNYSLESGVTYSATFTNIQVELGDTATPYVPYGYLPMRRMKYKLNNVCQLLDKSKYPATTTISNVTFNNNGDGSYTVSGVTTASNGYSYLNLSNNFKLKKDHIYLNGGNKVSNCYQETVWIDENKTSHWSGRYKADSNSTVRVGIIRIGTVDNTVTLFPQLFDLTEMYGAGHEPTTLEDFRADFPEDLYEYTPYCWAKINKFLINKGDIDRKNIYGVDKVGQSSPTLIRTDSSVGLNYTVGNSEIVSDFDSRFPWCEMKEVVDEYSNVFIRIPKFYTKITKNTDGTYKHQISGYCHEGFSTLFVDGKGNELNYVLVGKYEGSSVTSSDSNYDAQNQKVKSKSGQTVLTGVTRGTYRTRCRNVGIGYQQYDFLIDAIIKELFMIEFATTNSQSIMYGYTNLNSNAVKTGITDTIITSSGSPVSNTDGKHACKYRGIENPFGNVWKWCDGINFDTEKIYVCEEPEYYADDKYDAPYTYMGNRCSGQGYVKVITPLANNPLLGFVTELGADNNTYYSDYYQYAEVGTVLACGEAWYYGVRGGLWSWYCNRASSYIPEAIGGRLCYKPDKSQDYTARNWTKI